VDFGEGIEDTGLILEKGVNDVLGSLEERLRAGWRTRGSSEKASQKAQIMKFRSAENSQFRNRDSESVSLPHISFLLSNPLLVIF
jgi:hypothetical protein